MKRIPPVGSADRRDPDQTRKRNALELERGADLAGIFRAAAIRVGAIEHNPREPVKAVGHAYADGTLAVEEAAGHPDRCSARADRGCKPVRRQCRCYAAASFCPVVIDLLLQTEGNAIEL